MIEPASPSRVVQSIGRGKRLGVEAESGRDHAVSRRRIRFQRVVVRRRNHGRAPDAEVLDDGHRQRATLHRIRAGACFVQQNERRKRQRTLHLYNVGNVPGERTQTLRDRLFVANVGEHRAEHRKLGPAGGGDEQTGLRDERQQPRSLQCDRLAAGVGTGDDQHRHRRNQHDIDGHWLLFTFARFGLGRATA